MAGVDSETGERVCAKINHNDEYEGSAAQKKEIMLHMALKHGTNSPHSSSVAACSASDSHTLRAPAAGCHLGICNNQALLGGL